VGLPERGLVEALSVVASIASVKAALTLVLGATSEALSAGLVKLTVGRVVSAASLVVKVQAPGKPSRA
jgi:hypothetical protein